MDVSKKTVSITLFACCVVSLALAVYQLVGSRIAEGALSIVFSLVFLFGGVASRER